MTLTQEEEDLEEDKVSAIPDNLAEDQQERLGLATDTSSPKARVTFSPVAKVHYEIDSDNSLPG